MNLHVSRLKGTATIRIDVPTDWGRKWIRLAYRLMRKSGMDRNEAANAIVSVLMAVPCWEIVR